MGSHQSSIGKKEKAEESNSTERSKSAESMEERISETPLEAKEPEAAKLLPPCAHCETLFSREAAGSLSLSWSNGYNPVFECGDYYGCVYDYGYAPPPPMYYGPAPSPPVMLPPPEPVYIQRGGYGCCCVGLSLLLGKCLSKFINCLRKLNKP